MLKKVSAGKRKYLANIFRQIYKVTASEWKLFKNAEKGKWKKILVKIFRQAKKEVSKITTYAEKCKNFTKLKYTWRNQWMGVWCIKIQNIHYYNISL